MAVKVVSLTPNNTDKGGWDTVVGAASHHAALADSSDASYIEASAHVEIDQMGLTSYTLQPGETVVGVKVRVRASTAPNHTINVQAQTVTDARLGNMPAYQIPGGQSIQTFTTWMWPGAGDPWDADAADRAQMGQTMLDGLRIGLTLLEGVEEAGVSRIYKVDADLYVSTQARIVRRGNKLHLSSGPEARLWGVNYRTDTLFDQPLATLKQEVTEHAAAGFNLFRIHVQVAKIKTAAGVAETTLVGSELAKLTELLEHMSALGVYAELTLFGAYFAETNPAWYSGMTEAQRWQERREQARQIAGMYVGHPAVAYYGLGNEFLAPTSVQVGWFAGSYLEWIVMDPAGRSQTTIWTDWLANVTSASDGLKFVNPTALLGCGTVPPYGGSLGTLVPIVSALFGLDVVLPHVYPRRDGLWQGEMRECLTSGLPVVIQEFFLDVVQGFGDRAECAGVYSNFFDISGIVGHSDGRLPHQYIAPEPDTINEALFQMMGRWSIARAGQFRRKPRGGLRVAARNAVPRVGSRT